jgi:hypothetical protein
MTSPLELSIPTIDTTEMRDIRLGNSYDLAMRIEDNQPVDPRLAALFLDTTYRHDPSRLDKISKTTIPAVGAIFTSWLVQSWLDLHPQYHSGFNASPTLQVYLNDAWDIMSQGHRDVETTDLAYHAPNALLLSAGVYLATRFSWLSKRNEKERETYRIQQDYHRLVDAGSGNFDLSKIDNSIVAVVGHGKSMTNAMAWALGPRFLQVAQRNVKGLHVALPDDSNGVDSGNAYKRADVVNADQILVFPSAPRYELFVPSGSLRDYYDLGVDRIARSIDTIDAVCEEEGAALKPITIIGNPDEPVIAGESGENRSLHLPGRGKTLLMRAKLLEKMRGAPVNVLDVTKLMMNAAGKIAGERPLKLYGSDPSNEAYKESFDRYERSRKDVNRGAKAIRCFYAFSDNTTIEEAQPGDMVIIRDPTNIPALLRKGFDPGYVLSTPLLVMNALGIELDKRKRKQLLRA